MTPSEITEAKERMARFMGFGPYEDARYGTMWPDPTEKGNPVKMTMLYNTNWNWLMKVWERFRDLRLNIYAYSKHRDAIASAISWCSLSEAFTALDEGIKWFLTIKK